MTRKQWGVRSRKPHRGNSTTLQKQKIQPICGIYSNAFKQAHRPKRIQKILEDSPNPTSKKQMLLLTKLTTRIKELDARIHNKRHMNHGTTLSKNKSNSGMQQYIQTILHPKTRWNKTSDKLSESCTQNMNALHQQHDTTLLSRHTITQPTWIHKTQRDTKRMERYITTSDRQQTHIQFRFK